MSKRHEVTRHYSGKLYKVKVRERDGNVIVSASPTDNLEDGFTTDPFPYDGNLEKLLSTTVRNLVHIYERGVDDGWHNGYKDGYADGYADGEGNA